MSRRTRGWGLAQRSIASRLRRLSFERLENRLVLSFSSAITAEAALLAQSRPYVEDEIVVALSGEIGGAGEGDSPHFAPWTAQNGDSPRFADAFSGYDLVKSSVLLSYNDAVEGPLTLVVLALPAESDVTSQLAYLDGMAEVAWASPNFKYDFEKWGDPRDLTPNDPLYASQYHHPLMDNNLAWDTTLGAGIVIAVTDDGMQLDHPDLAANLFINTAEIAGNGVDDDANGYIDDVNGWDFVTNDNDPSPVVSDDDHGTHVAGIAAGRTNNGVGIAGTAGEATIMPLRWIGDDGGFTSAITAAAYRYATDNGAQIVSSSYSIDHFVGDPVYTAGLQYLYDAGVLHFNSAGNNSQLNPARQAFHQSLLVASTTSANTKSSFSNYGTGIDISAPGSQILSTVTGNGYDFFSGTSMAAPNAAGAAALIWAANPSWTREQVAAQLLGTADDLDALNPAYAGLLGAGLANPYNALTQPLVPPQIASVTQLPPSGSTLFGTLTNLTVRLGNIFDAATIANTANWQLTGDGADNAFGTLDDVVIPLALVTDYMIGANELEFVVGAPLPNDRYEFRAVAGGLVDPFGAALDGDGNGTGGDDYVRTFDLVNPAQIHGSTWNDLDGSGTRDVGEPGLAGWTVYVDENDNGIFDAVSGQINEVETNNTIATAQIVDGGPWSLDANANILDSTLVPHLSIVGTGDGTFDYYAFTVDVAGSTGHFDTDFTNFDTELFLYTAGGTLLAENDDAGSDPGSSGTLDSQLTHTFASPGVYVLGVGRYDSVGNPSGIAGATPDAGHFYTLHISLENHAAGESEPNATTNESGDYAIADLAMGTYTLREVPTPKWIQTYPGGSGSHVVTLAESEVRAGIDFGNTTVGVLDHFVIDPISDPQAVDRPFSVTINALDSTGGPATSFDGAVNLSGWAGETAVSITPIVTGSFFNGVWTGQVTVHELADDMWLRADDGSGHVSTSNTFDVVQLAGDYNRSGTVDAADFVLWRKTLGASVTPYTGADGSGDGTVGPEDHGVWAANFGETFGAGSGEQGARSESSVASQFSIDPTLSSVLVKLDSSLQTDSRPAAAPRRLAAVFVESAERDAALVAWLASRSPGGDVSDDGMWPWSTRGIPYDSSEEFLFDALDSAFESLSADAA